MVGTDGGSPLLLPGPTIQQELQLWTKAGIPAAEALQAATHNAATILGAGQRIGLVQNGFEANLLLLDGNPVQDITATEHISLIIYRGERVNRMDLLKDMEKLNP